MIDEEQVCAREGCDITYIKKKHNQKYHDDECTRLATNRRMMDKYHARRKQLSGEVRYCTDCLNTRLSRYNNSQICSLCKERKEIDANESAVNMLMGVSWVA